MHTTDTTHWSVCALIVKIWQKGDWLGLRRQWRTYAQKSSKFEAKVARFHKSNVPISVFCWKLAREIFQNISKDQKSYQKRAPSHGFFSLFSHIRLSKIGGRSKTKICLNINVKRFYTFRSKRFSPCFRAKTWPFYFEIYKTNNINSFIKTERKQTLSSTKSLYISHEWVIFMKQNLTFRLV